MEDKCRRIVEDRMNGLTLQQIADKYGCTKQNISRVLHNVIHKNAYGMGRSKNGRRPSKCIYPAIEDWKNKNDMSYRQIAKEIGTSQTRLGGITRGEHIPSVEMAIKIAHYMGMTVEEAFAKEKEDDV